MNKIELNIKSPWALLITLSMAVMFLSVIALAEDEEDPVIGYTHDGLPVLESEIPNSDKVDMGKALGLRQLAIDIKGIQKIDTNVLNVNTVELYLDDDTVYTVIVNNCKLTVIDNFQFQTKGDGKLNVGDFAIVRRNPFKYFENPNLELTKEQVEAKLKDWDLDQRVCNIVAIQKATLKQIALPEPTGDVRG